MLTKDVAVCPRPHGEVRHSLHASKSLSVITVVAVKSCQPHFAVPKFRLRLSADVKG